MYRLSLLWLSLLLLAACGYKGDLSLPPAELAPLVDYPSAVGSP